MITTGTMMRGGLAAVAMAGLTLSGACSKDQPATEPAPEVSAAPTGASAPTTASPAATKDKGEVTRPRREIELAKPNVEPEKARAKAPDAPTPSGPPTLAALTPGPAVSLKGAAGASALRYLPLRTMGVFVVSDPQQLVRGTGADRAIAVYKDWLERRSGKITGFLGFSPFELDAWKSFGVAVDGPMGLAIFDPSDEAGAFFARVADRELLEKSLKELAGKAGLPVKRDTLSGHAALVLGDGDALLLFRDDLIYAVAGDSRGQARAWALQIASQSADSGFARASEFAEAVQGLVTGDDAMAWFNLHHALALTNASRDGGSDQSLAYLEGKIDEAKAAGDSQEVARWQRALGEEKRWNAAHRKERELERKLTDKLLGKLRGAALGLDIKRTHGEVSMWVPLEDTALLKRLLVNSGASVPAIFAATSSRPIFAASGTIDVGAYMELAEMALAAEGASMAEVGAQVKEIVGIDLQKDIIGQLTGEMGWSLQGDVDAMLRGIAEGADPTRHLGGSFILGLKDGAAFAKLFASLAGHPLAAEVVRYDKATGRVSLPLPTGKSLYIQVSANYLVTSTDPDFAGRIASGAAAESFIHGLGDARLKEMLQAPAQAAHVLWEPAVGVAWVMARSVDVDAPHKPLGAGVETPAVKAKLAELSKARAALAALAAKDQRRADASMRVITQTIGPLVESAWVTRTGLGIRVAQFANGPSLPEAVHTIWKTARKAQDDRRAARGALSEARQKVDQLAGELDALSRP